MDEIEAFRHRFLGGGVVGIVLLSRQTGNTMALGCQLAQQYLLMAQTIGEELLIERTGLRFTVPKEPSSFQFFPPGADHRAAGEEGELAGGDQSQVNVLACTCFKSYVNAIAEQQGNI